MTLLSLLPRVEPRMSHEPMHWCLNLKRSSACTNVSLLNLASVEPTDSSVTDSITDDSGLLALPSTSPIPPWAPEDPDITELLVRGPQLGETVPALVVGKYRGWRAVFFVQVTLQRQEELSPPPLTASHISVPSLLNDAAAWHLVFSSSGHFPMSWVRPGSHTGIRLDPWPGKAPILMGATETDRE